MKNLSKIKTYSFVSLDGYTAQKDNEAGLWLENNNDVPDGYGFQRLFASVDCVVNNGMHYATLQGADVWPFGDKKCYILAPHHFAVSPGIEAEVIPCGEAGGADYFGAVQSLCDKAAGDIWLAGDNETVAGCMQAGLIDEIVLNILPVTLGRGVSFFGEPGRVSRWTLAEHHIYENGVIRAQYTAVR